MRKRREEKGKGIGGFWKGVLDSRALENWMVGGQ